MKQNHHIILHEGKPIRRVWHNEEWYFNVVDIIEYLNVSTNPRNYWKVLKNRLQKNEGYVQLVTDCNRLKFKAADGKNYSMDAVNSRTIFRIVQSVPSPNVEPFKQWLADVAQERIDEIGNPEIAAERARDIYKAKGYPDDWIETRIKSIYIRQQLTDEWKNRHVGEQRDYSILTAEIAKATFGLTPSEHKNLKGLERENLRDHMTNFELIFTMLSEEATRSIAVADDAIGFPENLESAQKGGKAAGKARIEFEKQSGRKVVSDENFKNRLNASDQPSLSDPENH